VTDPAATDRRREGGGERRAALLAAAVVALGAALRFFRLGARGLWLDEAVSWLFASGPPGKVVGWLRLDSGPPLYYWLLGLWRGLWGDSEWALRSLSALAGSALVAAVWWVGRRLLGPRAALFAALVAALLPVQVRYSQEAQPLALLPLVGLAAMAALYRWVEEGRGPWLAATAAATTAVLYCHDAGLFLLAAGVVFALVRGLGRGRRLAGLAAFPAVAAAYLPWLPILGVQLGHPGAAAGTAPAWVERGSLGALVAAFRGLAPGGEADAGVGPSGLGRVPLAPVFCLALAVAVSLGGLAAVAWRERRRAGGGPVAAWLACYLLVPLLVAVALARVAVPAFLPGQAAQAVVPAFCLAAGAGLAALRPAALRWGVAAAWAALCLAILAGSARQAEGRRSERDMAAAIAADLAPGDRVLATSLTWSPLAYYLRQRPPQVPLLAFPPEIARHPRYEGEGALLANPRGLELAVDEALGEATAGTGARRLFLAFVPGGPDGALLGRLEESPRLGRVRSLGDFEQRRLGRPVRLLGIDLR
jgi:mannosyltransferase